MSILLVKEKYITCLLLNHFSRDDFTTRYYLPRCNTSPDITYPNSIWNEAYSSFDFSQVTSQLTLPNLNSTCTNETIKSYIGLQMK